ncbi:MAG: hypothetical protein N2Z62_16885 [Rhodobacteraceae bacterium]|nr:hypothetical protein [Paracoccaceae bacterium]
MHDDWIIDVLTDLKSFAEANDLPFLAASLEQTRRLAVIELARRLAENPARRRPHASPARAVAVYARRVRDGSEPHDA